MFYCSLIISNMGQTPLLYLKSSYLFPRVPWKAEWHLGIDPFCDSNEKAGRMG